MGSPHESIATPESLRKFGREVEFEGEGIVLHRGPITTMHHVPCDEDLTCWCSPIFLSWNDIVGPKARLMDMLREFYRVH